MEGGFFFVSQGPVVGHSSAWWWRLPLRPDAEGLHSRSPVGAVGQTAGTKNSHSVPGVG